MRLHQPSAYYGVASRPLGSNRIDDSGINAGFYERATAPEICDYYTHVMEDHFIASRRVKFLPMTDYLGTDDDAHHVRSLPEHIGEAIPNLTTRLISAPTPNQQLADSPVL